MLTDQDAKQKQTGQDIVEVASRYIQLQQSNKVLRGPCPFHTDSGNSFMISPAKNIFKCFGCGKEGGPIEFISAISNKN